MSTERLPIYGQDVQWTTKVLHLIGHPVKPSVWYDLVDEYHQGWTPEQAAQAVK